jgi:hypothetical protein
MRMMEMWDPTMDSNPIKSTHKVEVVQIPCIGIHPNADRLEVIMIYGYSVCVGKGDFKSGDLAIYIPPDSIVPEREEFKFVWEMKGYAPPPNLLTEDTAKQYEANPYLNRIPEKYRRIKAKVLRGIVSEGLLMPLTSFKELWSDAFATGTQVPSVIVGDDVAELLGITHYDPPEFNVSGDCESAPIKTNKIRKKRWPKSLYGWLSLALVTLGLKQQRERVEQTEKVEVPIPSYDIDAWQRYQHLLHEGEEVWITEKIHGSNARFVHLEDPKIPGAGRMYVGSHYQWKKDILGNAFWAALRQNPWIKSFCERYPGFVLYGELVPTQKLKYGQQSGVYRVFAFDVLDINQTPHKWLNLSELKALDWDYGEYEASGELYPISILDIDHWVPTVHQGAYTVAATRLLASGQSLVPGANHIREGVVIKPIEERRDPHFGRVILKIKSPEYLASKHSDE